MMTIAKLFEESCKLSDEMLESFAKSLWDEVRNRQRTRSKVAAMEFSVGSLVENRRNSRRLPIGSIGKVTRVGSSKVSVDFGIYGQWNCPGDFLKKAEKGAKVMIKSFAGKLA